MLNSEYDREYVFDIDAYLIEWYPSMDMQTRRSVCSNAYEFIDEETLQEAIDMTVWVYALEKLKIQKKEPESDD